MVYAGREESHGSAWQSKVWIGKQKQVCYTACNYQRHQGN